jgi:hypothetical protein
LIASSYRSIAAAPAALDSWRGLRGGHRPRRAPPGFIVQLRRASCEHDQADDDCATHEAEYGAEQPVHCGQADRAPRIVRDDAANQGAGEQHDQEHDRPAGPFAHARLGQRAPEPGIDEVGEMPGDQSPISQLAGAMNSRMNPEESTAPEINRMMAKIVVGAAHHSPDPRNVRHSIRSGVARDDRLESPWRAARRSLRTRSVLFGPTRHAMKHLADARYSSRNAA